MGLIAAEGDTWGLSGPGFLKFYLVAVLLAAGYLALAWRSVRRGRPMRRALTPYEAALLSGGPGCAIGASIMALRLAGAIEPAGPGQVRRTGWPTAGRPASEPLDRAIDAAIGKRVTQARDLGRDHRVAQALAALRSRLERNGLMVGEAAVRPLRRAFLVLVALVALGLVRLVAGLAGDRPIGFLLLTLVLLVPATVGVFVLIHGTTRRGTTVAGRAALDDLRARNTALQPSMSPAWQTYGAPAAAMAVALFGWAAIDSIDAEFAAATGLAGVLSLSPAKGLAGSGSAFGSSSSSSSTSYIPYVSSCSSSSSSCGSSSSSSCGSSSSSSCGGGGGGCGG